MERQARRRRRKDARQKEGTSPDQHNEGLSTDDEEKESDKQIFVQQIGEFSSSSERCPPVDYMHLNKYIVIQYLQYLSFPQYSSGISGR